MHDFDTSEMKLTDTVIKEVVNTSSDYFGDLIVLTHKAYALDRAWFKGTLSKGGSMWFKSDELGEIG